MAKGSDSATIDFGSQEWPSINDAFKRFLEAARGDPDLAVRELQRALEDDGDRLRSGYVRMPKRYQKPDGSPIWMPENQESGLLDCQFWRSEAQVHLYTKGVGGLPRLNKTMLGRYLFFVRRSDLDAIFTTARSAIAATVEAATLKPAIKKEDIARQVIQQQELYGRPAHTLSKNEFKTGTVRDRVNEELRKRNPNAERLSWDTINRALGRDPRRKKK